MRIILIVITAAVALVLPAPAHAIECNVSAPISAAELNSTNPTFPFYLGQPSTWYFEVTGMTPGQAYDGKLNWSGDPSNGAHPNIGADDNDYDGVVEPSDFDGYDLVILPRWWSPDGMLPGYRTFWDPYDPITGWVAAPGAFAIHLYPADRQAASGTTKCFSEVLP